MPKTAPKALKAARDLTLDELRQFRQRLRRYRARLQTSLKLAEATGAVAGAGHFDVAAYTSFRDTSALRHAVEMAEGSRFGELSVLLDEHRRELRSRRLGVLSMVPETTPPHEYASLLKEVVTAVLDEAEAAEAAAEAAAKAEAAEAAEAAAAEAAAAPMRAARSSAPRAPHPATRAARGGAGGGADAGSGANAR